MKKKIWIIVVSAVLVIAIVLIIIFNNITTNPNIVLSDVDQVIESGSYDEYLLTNANLGSGDTEIVVAPSQFTIEANDLLTTNTENYQSGNEVLFWGEGNPTTVTINVNVPKTALYVINFDYFSKVTNIIDIELAIKINDTTPYSEATQIILGTLWTEMNEEVSTDRYGNDVNMLQTPYLVWQSTVLKDSQRIYKDGLQFVLTEGDNKISFTKNDGSLLLGNITISPMKTYQSYEEYRSSSVSAPTYIERFEAEKMFYKSSSTISMGSVSDVGVEPFSVTKLKLNVIGSGSWNTSGDSITWDVEVPEDGYYHLSLKVLQNSENTTSYRTLYVNGEIPFEEAKHLAFSYQRSWQNVTIHGTDGSEYEIYLNKGHNQISLEVDSQLFINISSQLSRISSEMSSLGLNIVKFTNGNTSAGIDWNLEENFTTIRADINRWIEELEAIIACYKQISGFDNTTTTSQDLSSAISKLNNILEEINALPRRLSLLSEGSSCAAQLVAGQIDSVLVQNLVVDALYIHTSDRELPSTKTNVFQTIWVGIRRFFASFFDEAYNTKTDPEELEVWVNRSNVYVNMIQKLTDDAFTNQTGIKVKVSIMSDDGKLILANSANQQPDVALGVSAWIPNDYGMRGMLYDIRTFEDYLDVIDCYHEEQLVPMVYNEHLYGLPETENFYVLFYRSDILESLSLSVPNTWDDVIDMLPVLERYGMDFYIPLSSSSSSKSFDATSPFIYQFGGKIYDVNNNGMVTGGLDDENTIKAMEFITDLYTEYGIPYQVSNFFNEFRYGRIPIGIADFGTYLNLTNGAKEIKGLWDITLVPGIEQEDGTIARYMPGTQQAGIIFSKTDKPTQAWEFLKWWMSSSTQELFSETLVNTLGSLYLWNTANVDAFSNLSWNTAHKRVILEQWENLKETSRIPGYYIVEREISNTWNSVVYNDANLRSTLSDAMIKINREITRKMQEFGYVNYDGAVVREYNMPTTETIRKWREQDHDTEEEN